MSRAPQPLNPRTRLINPVDGTATAEGLRFFQALRDLVAGEQSQSVSLEDLEINSIPRAKPQMINDEADLMFQRRSPTLEIDEPISRSFAARFAEMEARLEELETRGFR